MTVAAIDLSLLPPPAVVELLDFEVLYAKRKAAMIALYPADQQADIAATLELESEPLAVSLQENTYRELILRTRVNDACYAVLLAFAEGDDLDQVAANLDVERLTITPTDDTAMPPTPAVMESDSDLRKRCRLSFQGYTTAGSEGSYVFHALSADGQVKDASAVSPAPCQVMVYVLSRVGNGEADDALIATVKAALNDEIVRPMTDQVDVQSAAIIEYEIVADLELSKGPDASSVQSLALAAAQAYADSVHMNGANVALSGLFKALHQPGVVQVNLTTPAANIAVSAGQAAYCTGITITTKVQDDG